MSMPISYSYSCTTPKFVETKPDIWGRYQYVNVDDIRSLSCQYSDDGSWEATSKSSDEVYSFDNAAAEKILDFTA